MEVLNEMPIIFTKDREWFDQYSEVVKGVRPGQVFLLPEDAIVVSIPLIVGLSQEMTTPIRLSEETVKVVVDRKGSGGGRQNTDSQIEDRAAKIMEYRAAGMKPAEIAKKVGVSTQTVYNTISRFKHTKSYKQKNSQEILKNQIDRDKKTLENDNKNEAMAEMLKAGKSNDEIAQELNTAPNIVAFKRRQMAGRGEL